MRDEITKKIDDKSITNKELNIKFNHVMNFFDSTLHYQDRDKVFRSLIAFGKALVRRGHPKLAQRCYLRLLKENDIEKDKVLFEYFWTYIVDEDFSSIIEIANKYFKNDKSLYNNSKLVFWVALSHQKESNEDEARNLFTQIIKDNPLSYYAILSAKLLSENKKSSTEDIYLSLVKKSVERQNTRRISSLDFDFRWLKRVIAWSKVNNPLFLSLEFNEMVARSNKSLIETHLLAAAHKLSKNRNYLESFKYIYRGVDRGNITVNKEILKLLFPKPYLQNIKRNAKKFDPIIALSLIRQESGFNRFARSHVGARGLMQLMPRTARRFRRVSTRQLYNTNTNIQIGTKFFNKLLTKYDNNLVYSLAAYNAGMGRIDDWQERNYVNDERSMLKNIENIPFLETRKYVKLIFRNIFFYKLLFSKKSMNDSEEFNKIFDIHVGFNR